MRLLGVSWGLGGFLLLMASAFRRLVPMSAGAFDHELGAVHYAALIVWLVFMIYSEAYKGFHRAFAPRFGARLKHLYDHPSPLLVAFAPLYAMCYIHATRKRRIVVFSLTTGIILLIILIKQLPQPWRGIIDVGVVAGLFLGTLSVIHFTIRAFRDPAFSFDPGLPEAS